MTWKILHSGVGSAQRNMDLDKNLLENIASIGEPILHFYDWDGPSATYGYFIDPSQYLNLEGADQVGLKLARRPTGGGIVFHLTDLAFSVLVPASHPAYSTNTLENYAFVNRNVGDALKRFNQEIITSLLQEEEKPLHVDHQHFCMAKPTIYDVIIQGKKVGGAAQRRTKDGFLHQGTLSIALPPEEILTMVLKSETQVWESMKNHSYLLVDSIANSKQLQDIRSELKYLLSEQFKKNIN
jgi:lipoate---protein ligase